MAVVILNFVHVDYIIIKTEVSVGEIESSVYTQIPGRDKDAVRTYFERVQTWKAPTEPV